MKIILKLQDRQEKTTIINKNNNRHSEQRKDKVDFFCAQHGRALQKNDRNNGKGVCIVEIGMVMMTQLNNTIITNSLARNYVNELFIKMYLYEGKKIILVILVISLQGSVNFRQTSSISKKKEYKEEGYNEKVYFHVI